MICAGWSEGGGKRVAKYIVEYKWKNGNPPKRVENRYVQPGQITEILNHDADVYILERDKQGDDKQGNEKLLLRFRKGVLSKENCETFYNNVIDFAYNFATSNRGNATGNNGVRGVWTNKEVKSNIIGFFDKWSPSQKVRFRNMGISAVLNVRPCYFNVQYPEKFKRLFPLLQEIDHHYAKLVPDQHAKQMRKARSIPAFHIPGTSFTTVTTNVNYRTTAHTDKGDDDEGFGNLVVLERGQYTGGETCFPEFGIGVDVREGDVLFMDVHQFHGNLPIKTVRPAEGKDEAIRLSIVCYLRKQIWVKTRGKTQKELKIWHDKFVDIATADGRKNKTRKIK